jgi:hypothetical protein
MGSSQEILPKIGPGLIRRGAKKAKDWHGFRKAKVLKVGQLTRSKVDHFYTSVGSGSFFVAVRH